MTPCEERGWKVGDRFEVVEGDERDLSFSLGSIIELLEDDGTKCPRFKLISGEELDRRWYRDNGWDFEYLDALRPIPKPTRFVPGETTLRDGTPAKVYEVYEDKIHGAHMNRGEWLCHCWGSDGSWAFTSRTCASDLMPNAAPETREVDVWVYWRGDDDLDAWQTEGAYDAHCEDKARRRIRVALTEGVFDD